MLPINEIYTCVQGEGPLTGIPHILIRFVGCPLRCQFKDSFCDTSNNSWKPEKGQYDWGDIFKIIQDNPKIHHIMITGGSPTMHPLVLQELCQYLYGKNKIVTIESEGSRFVKLGELVKLSLSPKLTNSIPKVGSTNPYTGQVVNQKHVQLHEKERYNLEVLKQWMTRNQDYWFKFVVSSPEDLEEIREKYIKPLHIHYSKVFLMPEGVTQEHLSNTQWITEECIKEGYNYTDRLHVRIYGDRRGV